MTAERANGSLTVAGSSGVSVDQVGADVGTLFIKRTRLLQKGCHPRMILSGIQNTVILRGAKRSRRIHLKSSMMFPVDPATSRRVTTLFPDRLSRFHPETPDGNYLGNGSFYDFCKNLAL